MEAMMDAGSAEDAVVEGQGVPNAARARIGMALSGGGFRAALLHLGALERLQEVGLYGEIDRIAGVSGGSLVAAHLARLHTKTSPPATLTREEWRRQVTGPFVRHVLTNHRWKTILRRVSPVSWLRPGSVTRAFAVDLKGWLTDQKLEDLPDRPNFIFCATDLRTGDHFYFERLGLREVDRLQRQARFTNPSMPVACAVAASAAFPPLLPPLRLHALTPGTHDDPSTFADFVDGGLYDNTGVEALRDVTDVILVSDGGGTANEDWDSPRWFPTARSLKRYLDIADGHGRDLQRRWLLERAQREGMVAGAWSIDAYRWLRPGETKGKRRREDTLSGPDTVLRDHFHDGPARESFLRDTACRIAAIRTDADVMSGWEIAYLLNHGYLECARALKHPEGVGPHGATGPVVLPGDVDLPIRPPVDWIPAVSPGSMEDYCRIALRDSSSLRLLGRPFDLRSLGRAVNRGSPKWAVRESSALGGSMTAKNQVIDVLGELVPVILGGVLTEDEEKRALTGWRKRYGHLPLPGGGGTAGDLIPGMHAER